MSIVKEKLLIIGAGIGQIPLLKKAKQRGIPVTVVTAPGDYPCISMADDTIYLDIYDRDSIVEEAKKRKITAVISDQNDLTNPTVAYVSEKLGLPGNKFKTVMSYCNKNDFRSHCEDIGIPVPKHIAINSTNCDFSAFECPLPWIVKPADSQSSIGVKKIETMDELLPAIKTALGKSPTHSAIVEEYFFGREVVCEGFIYKGEYYLLQFADRKYFKLNDLLIPSQTLFPSIIDEKIRNRIVKYERRISKYMNPDFAIVHSEYLIDNVTGDVRIVESALRGGGVYISSDLIPLATGIDINDVILDLALGNSIDVESVFSRKLDRASAYICFYLPDGIIKSVTGIEELQKFPFVHNMYIDNIAIGNHTKRMTYKGAREGPILIIGENRRVLEENITKVQNTLKIDVEGDSGISSKIFWE